MKETEARRPGESLRAAFGWNLVGTAIYAASQWAMLAVLARMGEPQDAEARLGIFVYGMAVAAPLVLLLSMQTRSILAADDGERHPFATYLWQRVIAMGLMVALGAAWTTIAQVDGAWVVFLIVVARAVEGVSELAHGLLQRERRMWIVGVSQVLRGLLGLLALAVGTYVSGDLVVGSVALVLAWAAVGLIWDLPRCLGVLSSRQVFGAALASQAQGSPLDESSPDESSPPTEQGSAEGRTSLHCEDRGRGERGDQTPSRAEERSLQAQLWSLSKETAALGLVSGVVALTTNLPRYLIESFAGARELGVFAALAYVMVALAMVTQSLSAAALPRMGEAWQRGDHAAVRKLTGRAIAVVSVPSVLALAPCWFFGGPLMALLYRPEFAAYGHLLWWFCLLAWLSSVAGVLRSTMTACGALEIQLPLSIATALLTGVATYAVVGEDPLWSGVLGLLAGRLFQVISHAVVVGQVLRPRSTA